MCQFDASIPPYENAGVADLATLPASVYLPQLVGLHLLIGVPVCDNTSAIPKPANKGPTHSGPA
ncbi:hypothetical protein DO72_5635 [Burkholderia pseudomallei]|nr:hypothetical protein DO72_5635 [Burkholderia pseudomallei]